ncbi:MAG: hypothetical protein K2K83_03175 [Rikenella sp.]|nr:hypothetical protein [Rikenella sp.]
MVSPSDWTTPQNDALWQDGVKTLFDPCPSGWQLPKSGTTESGQNPWASFSVATATVNTPYPGINAGFFWNTTSAGSKVWYPAGGFRDCSTGTIKQSGAHANYRSAGLSERKTVEFTFVPNAVYPFYAHIPRAYGFFIRCVRE